jgi:glutaredoxin
MYLGRNGGSLRGAEWRKVCSAVNGHRAAAGRRFNRSLVQCQKRVYTLRDQYKKDVAKHAPSGWRHFAQLRAFLGDLDVGPPPGFAAKMPHPSCVKDEEVEMEEEEEEEEEEEASGGSASVSVGRRTVPDILLDRSGGPPPGFRAKMPAAATVKGKEEAKEEVVKEEVGWTGPANGAASPPCCPAKVVTKLAEVATKLAEVYERVEMERLGVEKGKMEMEWGKRAAKTEAENLGETDDN